MSDKNNFRSCETCDYVTDDGYCARWNDTIHKNDWCYSYIKRESCEAPTLPESYKSYMLKDFQRKTGRIKNE